MYISTTIHIFRVVLISGFRAKGELEDLELEDL